MSIFWFSGWMHFWTVILMIGSILVLVPNYVNYRRFPGYTLAVLAGAFFPTCYVLGRLVPVLIRALRIRRVAASLDAKFKWFMPIKQLPEWNDVDLFEQWSRCWAANVIFRRMDGLGVVFLDFWTHAGFLDPERMFWQSEVIVYSKPYPRSLDAFHFDEYALFAADEYGRFSPGSFDSCGLQIGAKTTAVDRNWWLCSPRYIEKLMAAAVKYVRAQDTEAATAQIKVIRELLS